MIHDNALYSIIIELIDTVFFIFDHDRGVINPHNRFSLRHVNEAMYLTNWLFDADPFLP